ncbi:MAG: MBL fold metallo-hydrolase [Pseudomonadota bacterium]|jgi:glyoxylase-like metal-dependent hydrolase (beta-lactamase superfamily II)
MKESTIGHDDSGLDLPTPAPMRFPFEKTPARGEFAQISPDIYWLRAPLASVLNHINVYLVRDGDGWTIVDTGVGTADTQECWKKLLEAVGGGPIKRVIATHFHPDHVGNAGWFCREYDTKLWMSRTEMLMAKVSSFQSFADVTPEATAFYQAAGFNGRQMEAYYNRRKHGFVYTVEPVPLGYRRLQDGEKVRIGDSAWEVVVGRGHSPEHVCLYSDHHKILFSGDQVLPSITSNVSVMPTEPEGNPLKEWIDSLEAIRDRLPDDMLVLPAHGRPFYGLHARLTALIDGHEKNLRELHAMCVEPKRAIDVFPALFSREISDDILFMATGESIAHINCLIQRGKLARETDAQGVYRYKQTDIPKQNRAHAAE